MAVAVGRTQYGPVLPDDVRGVTVTVRVEMGDGNVQEHSYEVHPRSLNLVAPENAPVGAPPRLAVLADVI